MAVKKAFRPRIAERLTVGQTTLGVVGQLTAARLAAESTQPSRRDTFVWLVVPFFTLAVLRRAWMCDDAFILMRSVDNLVEGRGLVFNAGERVLGLTNPLWALLVAAIYSYLRNPYLTPVILGVVVSGAAAALLVAHGARNKRPAALVVVALCFSRAFVDFSTSGLENGLSHLLLVAYFLVLLRPQGAWLFKLSLLGALTVVNRPDLAVLVGPALILALFRLRRPKAIKSVLFGLSPAFAWYGFALVYYGFPLPNTVYAKLNARIPTRELAQQGLSYLVDTVTNDPLTAIIIVAALALLAAQVPRDKTATLILASLFLDLAHVVVIGGDFMSGRFLTPSVAVSAVVLSHYGAKLLEEPAHLRWAAAGVAGVVLSLSFSPFRDDPMREKKEVPRNRIANERAFYQDELALLVNLRPVAWKESGFYADGRKAREKRQKVTVAGNLGLYSWGAGPELHVVDNQALTDPLLARIPYSYSADWRSGHLGRDVPAGYLDTIEHGKNQLQDRCLARYYEQLSLIIHGPFFTWSRWKAIAALNLPGGITVRSCPAALEFEPPTVAQR